MARPGVALDLLGAGNLVREACIEAAAAAYEDAGVRGLCAEGRWEAAVAAVQALDLRQVLAPQGVSALPLDRL